MTGIQRHRSPYPAWRRGHPWGSIPGDHRDGDRGSSQRPLRTWLATFRSIHAWWCGKSGTTPPFQITKFAANGSTWKPARTWRVRLSRSFIARTMGIPAVSSVVRPSGIGEYLVVAVSAYASSAFIYGQLLTDAGALDGCFIISPYGGTIPAIAGNELTKEFLVAWKYGSNIQHARSTRAAVWDCMLKPCPTARTRIGRPSLPDSSAIF